MSMPRSPENEARLAEAYRLNREEGQTLDDAAGAVGMSRGALQHYIKQQSRAGKHLEDPPAMPGFEITKQTQVYNPRTGQIERTFTQQKQEREAEFEVPEGHVVKGVSALVGPDGRTIHEWVKTSVDDQQREAAFQAYLDGLKDEIPREASVPPPDSTQSDLLSQYTITDSHLGMLAWHEEAGEDYDLAEAERLLRGFLSTAIAMSPPSDTAILAQLGDFLHYDGHKPLTPEHGNLLDTDTRFGKVVRVALRVLRWCVRELLKKHAHVHILLADANHDPASGVWLREAFAMLFDEEPRVTVDTSASTYYAYQWGDVALFYHHGHKRGMKDVDAVFAGRFREVYGKSKHAYAHLGHRHSDEARTSHLMKIEQHETLAAKDAYAAQAGFPGGRSAKVIHYHKRFGEVSRSIITPEMISG